MATEEPDKSNDNADEGDRLEPQSMHPLAPEDALRGFMQVDPERVRRRIEQESDNESE